MALRRLEEKRNSRVISLVHREESMSILGFRITRYIDIEDSERLLRAIQLTDDAVPIDLVLHTPGGLVLAAEQIAQALRKHPAKITVFVPHYAMSGGTLVALAAAASVVKVVERKPIAEVDDQTIILADVAEKALRQVEETVRELLSDHLANEHAATLARKLACGTWTHDYPITVAEARNLGLSVSAGMSAYSAPCGTPSRKGFPGCCSTWVRQSWLALWSLCSIPQSPAR